MSNHPVRIAPVRWSPPRPSRPAPTKKAAGQLAELAHIPLPGAGPEHLVFDAAGRIVTGLADGRIVRLAADPAGDGKVETLASTGGRPLGVEFFDDDRLLICDAYRGLLRLDVASGDLEVLCDSVDGEPLVFCSNSAVAADGSVYFTQSSRRFDLAHYKGDLLEHSSSGRLFRYRDGEGVELIADGFKFANGVVLSPDGTRVVVAETGGYRLLCVSLADGSKSTLVGGLPGFPDNLTATDDGLIWIGMASPRDPLLDFLLPRHPRWRSAVWALPDRLQPGPKDIAWAIAVDQSGAIVHDLWGWGVGYRAVTVARQQGDRVYLGSLIEPSIAVLRLS